MIDAEPLARTHRDLTANVTFRETRAPCEPVDRMADAVRVLAFDSARDLRSEDLAFAVGMADAVSQLWLHLLKFDAADARWPDRDRCVLPAGRSTSLLNALSYLTGHTGAGFDVTGGDGRAVLGPDGQGLATSVGLALAERMLAARFGKSLVDHRTWVLASAIELRAGVSHEAICIAGELRLEKLTLLFAEEGSEDDCLRYFAPHGWATKQVDGGDPDELARALSSAVRSKKPSAIACRVRPQPESRPDLGWPDPSFNMPAPLRARWLAAGARGASARRGWLKRLARHPMRVEFERVMAQRPPETWRETVAALKAGELPLAGMSSGGAAAPELIADWCGAEEPDDVPRHSIPHGGRTQGIAAAMNGLAMHGGLMPCVSANLSQSHVLRPSMRLAGQARLRIVYNLADSGCGREVPARPAAEELACLRAMPDVLVMRPADRVEGAECWDVALRRLEGPSVIVLAVEILQFSVVGTGGCSCGGYLVSEPSQPRRATLIASGPELALAADARDMLAGQGIPTALVSLPCWQLFEAQDEPYRLRVLGKVPRFGIEATSCFGWERWLGSDGVFVGDAGRAPHPYDQYRSSVITPETISAAVVKRLGP